jgi:hypothetical protein
MMTIKMLETVSNVDEITGQVQVYLEGTEYQVTDYLAMQFHGVADIVVQTDTPTTQTGGTPDMKEDSVFYVADAPAAPFQAVKDKPSKKPKVTTKEYKPKWHTDQQEKEGNK